MSGSEIILAPGSGKTLTRSLLDKNNQPVDFATGTWRADLTIIEYPDADAPVFAKLSSVVEAGSLRWLTLNNDSSVTITPDPDITSLWDFHKFHYEFHIQGPNALSKRERVDHGPFRLDR
jgi:hypothetical protein